MYNFVDVATEVKRPKREYIQTAEILTVGGITDLIAEKMVIGMRRVESLQRGCAYRGAADFAGN